MQNETHISAPIQEQMDYLRQRIRRYVWIEGIAVAIVWLCLTFWVGLAIDYLPVRLGATEMPRSARAVLLIVISLVLLWILYRFVLRRAFAQLRARNLAVLLERTYPEFRDSLLTAVELDQAKSGSDLEREMLEEARKEANSKVENIDVDKALNYRPMIRACTLAGMLLLSVICFGIFASSAFGVWCSRLYGLSDRAYPRRNQIELVGFENDQLVVARGSDVRIRVRADARLDAPPPKVCTIYFTTSRGRRGRVNMSKQGLEREGYQYYQYEGKPFRKILGDVEFDVVGGDHRVSNHRVVVVDSPQVTDIKVRAELPDYTALLPREESYHAGMQFVRGSSLKFMLSTNKPIVEVTITDTSTGEIILQGSVDQAQQQFQYNIDKLENAISHEVELLDRDGIHSVRPYRIAVGALEDSPPKVDARLKAIGNAVTKNAVLPIVGTIEDDFGVAKTWIEIKSADKVLKSVPFSAGSDNRIETEVDLRALSRLAEDALVLKEDMKISLTALGQDHFDLDEAGNIGESDRFELEVVTPNQLLALLEARELGLRKRFEQIIGELEETRDSLTRIQANEAGTTSRSEEADQENQNSAEAIAQRNRARAMMQLRVQRGYQRSQRASQEILGVALSFEDIRQELINNRIDSADRQARIERDIATPLKQVAEDMFPQLSSYLQTLERNLSDEAEVERLTILSVRQMDEILSILKAIRDKMLDLETYNELIDQLRSLIREQDDLIDRTKKKRKESALDLLK